MIFYIVSWYMSSWQSHHYYLECESEEQAKKWCKDRDETYIEARMADGYRPSELDTLYNFKECYPNESNN